MLLRDYDRPCEEEADWLAGCLQLPRTALLSIKKMRLLTAETTQLYGVSQRMLSYQMAASGVGRRAT